MTVRVLNDESLAVSVEAAEFCLVLFCIVLVTFEFFKLAKDLLTKATNVVTLERCMVAKCCDGAEHGFAETNGRHDAGRLLWRKR